MNVTLSDKPWIIYLMRQKWDFNSCLGFQPSQHYHTVLHPQPFYDGGGQREVE